MNLFGKISLLSEEHYREKNAYYLSGEVLI